nr:2,3-bisphosphoglycerate-independent phosphoglycerate mutase [Ipomoea batatas]
MILDAIEQVGGIYVVTADHGNAEDMVPIAIGGPGLTPGTRFRRDVPTGGLANVAATVMNLHGFEAPSDYETTLIRSLSRRSAKEKTLPSWGEDQLGVIAKLRTSPTQNQGTAVVCQIQRLGSMMWG